MSDVFVLPELVKCLSEATGISEDLCELFVKELVSEGVDCLARGTDFVIKDIGAFRNVDGTVRFEPAKELAESINQAFDCFERVELSEGVDYDDIDSCPLDGEVANESSESESENAVPFDSEKSDITSVVPPPVPEEDKKKQAEVIAVEPLKSEPEQFEPERPMRRKSIIGIAYFSLGFVACGIICTILYFSLLNKKEYEAPSEPMAISKVAEKPALRDSVVVEKALVADTIAVNSGYPKYYKVTETAYLSNVSRKYYGHYAFWIYIYIENKNVIKNPDNIPVGIVLKIPSPEKYGIDKNNPESIKKAELKAIELFGQN